MRTELAPGPWLRLSALVAAGGTLLAVVSGAENLGTAQARCQSRDGIAYPGTTREPCVHRERVAALRSGARSLGAGEFDGRRRVASEAWQHDE